MKLGVSLAIVCAVLVHGAVLAFGGLLFMSDKKDHGTLQEVELLSEEDAEKEKEKEKAEEPDPAEQDELETEEEEAPDPIEMSRSLELSPLDDAPALDAASLGAIEQALNGGGGGGDFGDALSFNSGGRIGSLGKVGGLDQTLESAFSLADIDQKPRPIIQGTPLYPSEMRGKDVEGVVTVIFVVDASGKVANPRAENASHPAFEKPALDAVKQWKFEPAVRGGQRVACKMRIPIRFQRS